MLATGIDDWGGVSPVTADHVNPERPWPDLDLLRRVTEAHGLTLAPRLTIYPERALDAARWLDPALHFPVLDRSDAEGLGRDDPGAHHPERVSGTRDSGDGAEVVLVGDRSTAWYSGAPVAPPVLVPAPAHAGGAVAEVLAGVRAGQEPGVDELVTLFGARGPEVAAVAALADELRPPPSATPSPGSTTATSTTPTCARSSAGSAGSPRARCRSTCAAPRTCSRSTTSPSASPRRGSAAPPR